MDTSAAPELPGMPPADRLQRAGAARRRLLCGYTPPKKTSSCRTCAHLLPVRVDQWRCTLHDFPVELGAICASWEPPAA